MVGLLSFMAGVDRFYSGSPLQRVRLQHAPGCNELENRKDISVIDINDKTFLSCNEYCRLQQAVSVALFYSLYVGYSVFETRI